MADPLERGRQVSTPVSERARRAVVDRIAELVWRARGRPRSNIAAALETPMERLVQIGRGDPEAISYGLSLADGRDQEKH